MYREEVLDHYKRPRNTGTLETEFHAEGENPSCGDDTHIYVEVKDGKISKIRHETDGCAISTAGISIISEELKGKEVEEVRDLGEDWMLETLGIDVSPMRKKCAMLGLKTIQKALEEN
ncbi:MAG: iron-sulfur cluster assembly scaffold protein [Candidatus Nanosalina sp.]